MNHRPDQALFPDGHGTPQSPPRNGKSGSSPEHLSAAADVARYGYVLATPAAAVPVARYGYVLANPATASVSEARSGLRGVPTLGRPSFDDDAPLPDRPLRMIHVGQSMVRAGIEQWLKGLVRFLDPRRVQVTRCVATVPEHIDPEVVAELGLPVEVGQREAVRAAARDCDVLLCWGPDALGEWLADCRPPLCVMVAHGEGPWTRQIVEGCAPVLDHVVAVSRRVWENNCRDLPSTIINNGIDTTHLARTRTRAESRRRLGFGADDFVLGYVGRFSPEKRPHVVIEAVARLPHRFKAMLVGWGVLQNELFDLANRLIPGRFAFTRADGAVGDVYEAMDALCLASEEEGFGLVTLEAMMCERPVIATPVGGAPELIVDRVNGLLVSGTPNSVRDAAERLHRHPHWARALGLEARAAAEEMGHARLMARRYEDLLLRLWAEKTSGRRARNGVAAAGAYAGT